MQNKVSVLGNETVHPCVALVEEEYKPMTNFGTWSTVGSHKTLFNHCILNLHLIAPLYWGLKSYLWPVMEYTVLNCFWPGSLHQHSECLLTFNHLVYSLIRPVHKTAKWKCLPLNLLKTLKQTLSQSPGTFVQVLPSSRIYHFSLVPCTLKSDTLWGGGSPVTIKTASM